jgi:uncharacterized membrane protein
VRRRVSGAHDAPRQEGIAAWRGFRRFMQWNRRYARRSYISGSMWVVPLVALLLYACFHRGGQLRSAAGWSTRLGLGIGVRSSASRSQGAGQLADFITLNLSFLVFTFGSLLVAIQVAGGQYTPRIIATTLLRDNVIRVIVGVFLFTLAFAMRVLTRTDDTVKQLDLLRRRRARHLLGDGVPVPDRLRARGCCGR